MKYLPFAFILITILDFIKSSDLCTPIAKCDPENIQKDICLSLSPNSTAAVREYNISRCANGKICATNNFDNLPPEVKCVEKKDRRLYYAGERCYGNSTCYSGHCDFFNDTCIGRDKGESCQSNENCGIGLFCFNSHCEYLVQEGGICSKDTDCIITHGCSNAGRCFPYYSLSVGEITDHSHFCKSNFYYQIGTTMYCAETKLTKDDCYNTGKCLYDVDINKGVIHKGEMNCECSYAYTDKKFCKMDTTDPTWTGAIRILKEIKDVHTERRFTPKYLLDRKTVGQAQMHPKLKDVDMCVIDYIFTDSSAFVGVSLISLVFLLLF